MLWATSARGLPPSTAPANASSSEEAVRCVNLPCAAKEDALSLYVARTKAKLPAAVLVLCPDKGEDIKKLLTSPAWQNFAEDYSLDLVAVVATTGSAPAAKNTPPPAGPSQAALVLQAVDHEFGGGIPILLDGGPQQAAFAKSLLTTNPKRVLGWCLHAPSRLPDATSATPPGVVVCYKEDKSAYDALMQDFIRDRKKGARLTWVALAGDKPAANGLPALDSFVREYLAATLKPKLGMDAWENIETKRAVNVMDLNSHPESMCYLPHVTLASSWAALHVPGGPSLAQQPILEREEDTFNPAQPKLHLYLRKPLSAVRTGGKIEGVLAYATWFQDRARLLHLLQDPQDRYVRYAEAHRLALLTWDTATAWSLKESADQRSQQQNFQDDLGFDRLASAWERGVHVLCHDAGLPENDFLLAGISRGAQWAHRLALRRPAHFLAIHIHINSSYDLPTPAAKNMLWLQTTGEREAGYEAAKRFYKRCRDLGYPIIFKAGPNLAHDNTPQLEALGLRFFDYALDIRAKRDALVASAQISRGRRASPSMWELSGLAAAPFYADFINQDVYGAEEKDMVPAGQRVPLPTQILARAWGGSMEAPALLPVSNLAADPSKLSTAQPPAGQMNYFGSTLPSGQSPADAHPRAVKTASGEDAPPPGTQADAAKTPDAKPAPTPSGPEFAERYQLAIQHAVAEVPALAQADSALNAAFLGQYQRLKGANDALLADPTWPEQVARLVRGQAATHPDYAREFKASVERAVLAYPALAEADSPMNAAFIAEYQRLQAVGDALLANPLWPEQVAQTANGKLATPAPR